MTKCSSAGPGALPRKKLWASQWEKELTGPYFSALRLEEGKLDPRVLDLVKHAFPEQDRAEKPRDRADRNLSRPPAEPDCSDSPALVATQIWRHSSWVLCTQPKGKWAALHQTLRVMAQAAHGAVFPSHLKTRRNSRVLEALLLATRGMNELLYLLRRPASARARNVRYLLPEKEGRALDRVAGNKSSEWRKAVRRIIYRQKAALLGGAGRETPCRTGDLYMWNTPHLSYLGFAHAWRKEVQETRPGSNLRGLEHAEKMTRWKRPGAGARRYRAGRRAAPGTTGFLFVRRARVMTAKVMEHQGINGLNVSGNDLKQQQPNGVASKSKRKRPPPWAKRSTRGAKASEWEERLNHLGGRASGQDRRLGKASVNDKTLRKEESRGPLDTRSAQSARAEKVRRMIRQEREESRRTEKRPTRGMRRAAKRGAAAKEEEEKEDSGLRAAGPRRRRQRDCPAAREKYSMGYEEAYDDLVARRFHHNGQVGPADIFHPRHKRIALILWARPGWDLDWDMVMQRWKMEFPVLKAAENAWRVLPPGRAPQL